MEREKGMYWVCLASWEYDHGYAGGWFVAFWNGERWELPGTDWYTGDDFWDQIDERRLTRDGVQSPE